MIILEIKSNKKMNKYTLSLDDVTITNGLTNTR